MFGSPSGFIDEPPSSLSLSVVVSSFLLCSEVSSLQCFLFNTAPFVEELLSSELPTISSSLFSLLSFGATGNLLCPSYDSASKVQSSNYLFRPFLFTLDSASQVHDGTCSNWCGCSQTLG